MPVNIKNPEVVPEIVMDKLHVDSFTIKPNRVVGPKRVIDAVGVAYGDDQSGNRHYASKSHQVGTKDFDAAYWTVVADSNKYFKPFEFQTMFEKEPTITINESVVEEIKKEEPVVKVFVESEQEETQEVQEKEEKKDNFSDILKQNLWKSGRK